MNDNARLMPLLQELGRQSPALIVLCVLVYFFFTFLEKQGEVLKSISDECHQATRDGYKVMSDVAEAISGYTTVIQRHERILLEVIDALKED